MPLFKRRPRKPASSPARGAYSIVAAGTTVHGDVEAEGTIRVDGAIAGSIVRADAVMIGAQGSVAGDVSAREIVVAGRVEGTITASGRAELQASAFVAGAIETASVAIHEGATMRGQLAVRTPSTEEHDALPLAPKLAAAGGDKR